MYRDKMIGVVVTAYNEQDSIEEVIDTIPPYVDRIYVVDDASTDNTPRILAKMTSNHIRLVVIRHEKNCGAGGAKLSGYKAALKDSIDVIGVMDGDGQMDPIYLDKILSPVIDGSADYAKGNRLSTPEDRKEMPKWRLFGNFLLTFLTRISSGYWHLMDPQNGYLGVSRETLERLDLDSIYKGWAYENDILVKLNVIGARVVDVPHPARYRKEHSGIRYTSFIITTSYQLFKDFFWRIWMKYIRYPMCQVVYRQRGK